MHALALTFTQLVLLAPDDKAPEDDKVVAGPIGAIIFVALILAVAVIGWALTRSLRTAERAKAAGAFGDEPEPDQTDREADPHASEAGPDSK